MSAPIPAEVSLASVYPVPFHVVTDDPEDAPILARFAPGTRADLHLAAGVALDLAGKVKGRIAIRDCFGGVVPEADWRPWITAIRKAGK